MAFLVSVGRYPVSVGVISHKPWPFRQFAIIPFGGTQGAKARGDRKLGQGQGLTTKRTERSGRISEAKETGVFEKILIFYFYPSEMMLILLLQAAVCCDDSTKHRLTIFDSQRKQVHTIVEAAAASSRTTEPTVSGDQYLQ
eukprot:scaffold7561_cov227-Skeletonema_dohrnii-CCMP3373.AAC.5